MKNVKFYKDSEGCIIAFFPDEYWDNSKKYRVCYCELLGQSPCSDRFIEKCTKAEPEEYYPLIKKLNQQGYDLLNIID